jgi:hypothetical protein
MTNKKRGHLPQDALPTQKKNRITTENQPKGKSAL